MPSGPGLRFPMASAAALTVVALSAAPVIASPDHEPLPPHRGRHVSRIAAAPRAPVPPAAPQPAATVEPRQGVVGYFGPRPFAVEGPFGQEYGYEHHGDVGYGLSGLLNGGGLRGYVECSNYYARTPGACGF